MKVRLIWIWVILATIVISFSVFISPLTISADVEKHNACPDEQDDCFFYYTTNEDDNMGEKG